MDRPMSREAREARRVEEIRRRLGCPFLEELEAAAYLLVEAGTLANYRVKGGGPRYRKHFGRVAYHIDDLELWSEQQARLSTSDAQSAEAVAR